MRVRGATGTWGGDQMHSEELLALVLVVWLLFRIFYLSSHARRQKARARQRSEASLHRLLAHPPFRAELEEGFGVPPPAPPPNNNNNNNNYNYYRQLLQQQQQQTTTAATTSSSSSLSLSLSLSTATTATTTASPAMHRLTRLRLALVKLRRLELREEVPSAALLPARFHVSVRRCKLLKDSWSLLLNRPLPELLATSMSVGFEGELGIDAGGLQRDWFDSVGRALAAGRGPLVFVGDGLGPKRAASDGKDLRRMLAVGRFLALAVLRGHPLPLQLSGAVCKHLLLWPLSLRDLQRLDEDFVRHRVLPLLIPGGLQDLEVALGHVLHFVAAPSAASSAEEPPLPLLPGGEERVVVDSDRAEYLRLLCEEKLVGETRPEVQCLLHGFWDLLPLGLLRSQAVTPAELSALISGTCDPDPEEWRRHSLQNRGSSPRAAQVCEWFWEVLGTELTAEQRCLLLRFATGSSRPPAGGFSELRPPFAVEVSGLGSPQHLPTAHTCANKL
ncbi:unnamed protein product, partial [Polarella glacialis]